jgi:AcrR family transcriptional regulator
MMQAAMRVFAEKGYQAATIRDIVSASDVAIGTFYFYFPDKETLFVHLYEETADFLLQAIQQAVRARAAIPERVGAGIGAYANIATFEPAVVQLLLVGSIGAIPSLSSVRSEYRRRLTAIWRDLLEDALETGVVPRQDSQLAAEAWVGAIDEVIISLISHPDPPSEAATVVEGLTTLCLRSVAFAGP